ncbi:WD40 repeat-like protein [Eremomyces bilateralis CBS 781.70]|uniref:WD40 repeat-like protein n=1 Tax=Eremomyces bilateralis CBS 781.70 TaxID=1392243 RepID=A0A6G1G5D9_9PEZI|nr:WD40 repeat-like protein [Eremomyces bilateralis CBS 781.70]KAF1813273.1 WD40 repeat-like protein [Eremomyces bilateralis CBS 781.70]
MVWRSPNLGAMNNGGAGVGGGPGGPQEGGQVGTEYTLQGVMRFLQIEWHNHERARNAWDIERAEMKAKIAKQEGDVRNAKKLNEQLDKQIRMLERALKAERAKSKAAASGEKLADSKGEVKVDVKGKSVAKSEVKAPEKPPGSFLELEGDRESSDQDKDSKDKSHVYLQKTVEEVTYLLTPPAQPPQSQQIQALANSTGFMSQPGDLPLSLEEVYMQQRAKQQQQQQQGSMLGHPSAAPNHQPPPLPSNNEHSTGPRSGHPQQQSAFMTRGVPSQMPLPQQPPSTAHHLDNRGPYPEHADENVERITHTYDNMGRPISAQEESNLSFGGSRLMNDEPDGWNFEDNPLADQTSETLPRRRPDQDLFPSANNIPMRSPPRSTVSHRRKSSGSTAMVRRRSEGIETNPSTQSARQDPANFKVRFALRGHLDVVRSVIFTGGGSPSEPEICTAGDDGMIKRWIIPASYPSSLNHKQEVNDLDIQSYFTHRGHDGAVTSLAACPVSASFSTGGRASGDGWIFSGGQDASVRVWERGRVDPKATLEGHTDAVWTVCVLPATCGAIFGPDSANLGGPDRVLLASGSADGTVKIWAVSAPPQLASPQAGSRRGAPGTRRHSVTSGSNYPSSPQPSIATNTPFHYTLVHSISRAGAASPTCIAPLSPTGETFVVAYADASILIYDTRTGEEVIGMASAETYDGTVATGVNAVVAIATSQEGLGGEGGRGSLGMGEDEGLHGATGSSSQGGVEGVIISGHEDRFIRFFDANSGQCTYSMLAHPSAISSLSLSKDGREAVSAGHDASIRFWSLEKRICTQEITSHRIMRGEGVCSVVWSQDGRLVVSAGGDGVVKVFAR